MNGVINAIIRLMILSTYISKLQTKQHLMERSILKLNIILISIMLKINQLIQHFISEQPTA
jgi:hypothetical protein